MTIQPITSQPVTAAGEASQASAARTPSQSMDSDVFMSLLVTQLKNQNPSAPMDTNQMMSQTLQLSMMEKMTELTTNSKEGFSLQMRTAAAQLIGQSVGYTLADGTTGTGIAKSVSYAGSVPSVMIGDLAVPLDSVTGLTAPAAS
jgi:flagellar basal-body rod modification protein FlgD